LLTELLEDILLVLPNNKRMRVPGQATITSKLRHGCVAVFYQTSTMREGEFIDKSFLCSAGANGAWTVLTRLQAACIARADGARLLGCPGLDAMAPQLWHKIALRQDVGNVRFGKLPSFTHVLAYASPRGGLERAPIGACGMPDVFHRGGMEWSKAMGVDAAVWICRFLRNDVACTEVLDPFCGSGTVLASANYLGMHAVGVDISPKKARHAGVLRLYRTDDGVLVARRSSDTRPGGVAQAQQAAAAETGADDT
jgi:hypothetical protein